MKTEKEIVLEKLIFDIQELGGLEVMELNGCDTSTLIENINTLKEEINKEPKFDRID